MQSVWHATTLIWVASTITAMNVTTVCHKNAQPYEARQNALAERLWGMLLKPTRTYLAEANMPHRFWTYAIQHSCHLHNVLPTRGLPEYISPYEKLYDKVPDLSKIKVFGCKGYWNVPDEKRKYKLDPPAMESTYLGRDLERGGDIIYAHEYNLITTAFHITYNEDLYCDISSKFIAIEKNNPKDPLKHYPSVDADVHSPRKDPDIGDPYAVRTRPITIRTESEPAFGDTETAEREVETEDPRYRAMRPGETFIRGHCGDPRCILGEGHLGPHDYGDVRCSKPASLHKKFLSVSCQSLDHTEHV